LSKSNIFDHVKSFINFEDCERMWNFDIIWDWHLKKSNAQILT
jgi:hypothetical protein